MRFYVNKNNKKIYFHPGANIAIRKNFVDLYHGEEFSFDHEVIERNHVKDIVAEPGPNLTIGAFLLVFIISLAAFYFQTKEFHLGLPFLLSIIISIAFQLSWWWDKQEAKKFNRS